MLVYLCPALFCNLLCMGGGRRGGVESSEIVPYEAWYKPRRGVEESFARGLAEACDGISSQFLEELRRRIDLASRAASMPEKKKGKRVGFEKAAKALEGLVDLPVARMAAVRAAYRWGLADLCGGAGAYDRLLNKATIGEKGLHEVRERLQRGERLRPVFDPGGVTLDELIKVLFERSGIPCWERGPAYEDMGRLRRVDPRSVSGLLPYLDFAEPRRQCGLVEGAYRSATSLDSDSTGPRILFTPDEFLATNGKGMSPVQHLQVLACGGADLIDPRADVLRMRAQVDAAVCGFRNIKMEDFSGLTRDGLRELFKDVFVDGGALMGHLPDTFVATIYPNYVLGGGDGWVLSLTFSAPVMGKNAGIPMFKVGGVFPHEAGVGYGSRIGIG